MKTLLITIAQDNTKTAQAFENLLGQIHNAFWGEKITFEMIVFGQNIGFCMTAKDEICDALSGQIYSMNPTMEIKKIPELSTQVNASKYIFSSEIKLSKNDLLPIKQYSSFDGDSLSGMLNTLSKTVPGQGAWIQMVCEPQKDSGFFHWKLGWRKFFLKISQKFWVKYWFKGNMQQTFSEKIQEKSTQKQFKTALRILSFGNNPEKTKSHLQAIISNLSNYNTVDLNGFSPSRIVQTKEVPKIFQERKLTAPFFLSQKEVATLYHFPNEKEVPNLIHVLSKKGEPPANLPWDTKDPEISFFGQTNFHEQNIPFGIKRSDRRRHLYTLGKSGSGKSKLLELLIQNDINAGKGVGVLDPHGDLVDNILKIIPEHRVKDAVIFDPTDTEFPVAFNPLAGIPDHLKIRVTIGFIEIFKKLFGANWTPRLEHVLRYTTLALLDTPGTSIFSILKMLTDKNYRQDIVRNIKESNVKNFWTNEFAGWSEKFDAEAITPLLNKVGQFVATNMIRNIVGQSENLIDFREIMDGKKILLMKVSKGILGEENSQLLGAMAVTKIYQAAMSRADIAEEKREDFYFYVDEFQNFATDTFDEILSEARKYRLNLTIAHQFLGQLSENIRKTVFGNVGSMITFRVGGEDAAILEQELQPKFEARDIINLGVREFYTKMSIDGEIKEPFSGKTLNMQFPKHNFANECINFSRKNYARPKHIAEDMIEGKHQVNTEPPEFVEPIL